MRRIAWHCRAQVHAATALAPSSARVRAACCEQPVLEGVQLGPLAPRWPAHQPVGKRRCDAPGGAEGFDQFAALERLAHQRQPRQRHALAGQRGLDLLVGEVQVQPARAAPASARRAARSQWRQLRNSALGRWSSSSSSVWRARSAGARQARRRAPQRRAGHRRHHLAEQQRRAGAARRRGGSSAARGRSRGRRGRPARRWPRCGCRCRDARARTPASRGSSHSEANDAKVVTLTGAGRARCGSGAPWRRAAAAAAPRCAAARAGAGELDVARAAQEQRAPSSSSSG